jgi:CRISPR-associated protein Csh2
MNWGYSLHPVELLKSNTITTIMNDDSSTFGKQYKLHYGLIGHYGTVNKYSAIKTGMTEEDLKVFRKALVQGMMNNQTNSKQGQTPLMYLELIYKPDFDGYVGDLRRFLKCIYNNEKPIRKLDDIKIDFISLTQAISEMKKLGYLEKVIGWIHPFVFKNEVERSNIFFELPEYESIDLWKPIEVVG